MLKVCNIHRHGAKTRTQYIKTQVKSFSEIYLPAVYFSFLSSGRYQSCVICWGREVPWTPCYLSSSGCDTTYIDDSLAEQVSLYSVRRVTVVCCFFQEDLRTRPTQKGATLTCINTCTRKSISGWASQNVTEKRTRVSLDCITTPGWKVGGKSNRRVT